MANGTSGKALDFEAEVVTNYAESAARFDKLAKLAKQKAEALEKQYDAATDKATEAWSAASEAHRVLDEVNARFDAQTKRIETLEQQRADLGKQIEAARSGSDSAKIAELNTEFNRVRAEIKTAQQERDKTEEEQLVAIRDADAKDNVENHARIRAEEIREQIETVKSAGEGFADAAEKYADAGHNRDIADVAANGDADATRKAVLAEADRVAGDYHKTAAEQAEVFEQLRQAEATRESMQGQLDVSKREQSRLQEQVTAAEKAGRVDEAASLKKELEWRTDRTNQLTDRLVIDGGNVEALKQRNDELHKQAQTLKEDSEKLRKLSNEPAEKIEDTFRQREEASHAEARTATPVKGDDADAIATDLEEEAANAEATPDGDTTTPATDAPDPGASLDDIDTGDAQTASNGDAPATASTDTASTDTADPGASLDDIDTGTPAPATAAPDGEAAPATEAPRIVDDEMLQPAAAADTTTAASVAQEPAVQAAIEDASAQETQIEAEQPAFEEPPVEPVAQEPEPEPEPAPEPEPEFAE